MEFIDFIFVNCCLILNIKSVKILKKSMFVGGNFQMYSIYGLSCSHILLTSFVLFIPFFLGTKIIIPIPYPYFECKTVGRVDIGKFTVNKANVKRLVY